MPRRHNRRRTDQATSLDHLAHGGARLETAGGRDWYVRSIPASRALKRYACPGCAHPIETGVAHLVVWEAEGLFGSEASVADRRHWHQHCWRIGGGR